MEDSFQNLIQTLQVSGYTIQTHEHTSNMSSIDQQHHQSIPGPNSYHLPGQHSCLLENITGIYVKVLQLNPKKYKFNKLEVEFLRYIIGIKKIKIDSEKVKVIQQ